MPVNNQITNKWKLKRDSHKEITYVSYWLVILTTIKEDPGSASKRFPFATNGVFPGVDIIILLCLIVLDVVLDRKAETETSSRRNAREVANMFWIALMVALEWYNPLDFYLQRLLVLLIGSYLPYILQVTGLKSNASNFLICRRIWHSQKVTFLYVFNVTVYFFFLFFASVPF